MKLIADLILYLFRKLGKAIFLLFIGLCILSAYQEIKSQIENETNRKRILSESQKNIEKAVSSLDNTIDYWEKKVRKQNAHILIIENETAPNKILHPFDYALHMTKIETEKQLYESYISKLNTAKKKKTQIISSVDLTSYKQPAKFIQIFYGVTDWFTINFLKYWMNTVYFIVIVLIAPFIWKAGWYYIITPLSQKRKPVNITDKNAEGNITAGISEKILSITLNPSESIAVRMDWIHRHQENCEKRTRLLWQWSAPFISYASGLHHLTEIKANPESGTEVDLAHSKNPLNAVTEIILKGHPGVVVYPKYIVGISGDINLKPHWRLFSLHSWVSGRFRYISFYGTGKLYLTGYGYVKENIPDCNISSVNPNLVVGFDGRLEYKISRTETFFPYLKGLNPLMNDSFTGSFPFFCQGAFDEKIKNKQADENPIWTIIGRILGF